jgi:hypothetical protein
MISPRGPGEWKAVVRNECVCKGKGVLAGYEA